MSGDAYLATGSLDGVKPPEMSSVGQLTVRALRPDTAEGLTPVTQFRDLEVLELERLSAVDLSPLRDVRVVALSLREVEDVDLAPVAEMDGLEILLVWVAGACTVLPPWRLPKSLKTLSLTDGPDARGSHADLRQLIEAVDWEHLNELQDLHVIAGPPQQPTPLRVDLGFIIKLTALRTLRIRDGVWHDGPRPSPLEPPFDGLPSTLKAVSIDAWDPNATKELLQAKLPEAEISVSQRYGSATAPEPWQIDEHKGQWSTYGSLADALGKGREELEYDALNVMRRRLRDADPALLRRLDFDQESDGTAIMAATREDLERALTLLGLRDSQSG